MGAGSSLIAAVTNFVGVNVLDCVVRPFFSSVWDLIVGGVDRQLAYHDNDRHLKAAMMGPTSVPRAITSCATHGCSCSGSSRIFVGNNGYVRESYGAPLAVTAGPSLDQNLAQAPPNSEHFATVKQVNVESSSDQSNATSRNQFKKNLDEVIKNREEKRMHRANGNSGTSVVIHANDIPNSAVSSNQTTTIMATSAPTFTDGSSNGKVDSSLLAMFDPLYRLTVQNANTVNVLAQNLAQVQDGLKHQNAPTNAIVNASTQNLAHLFAISAITPVQNVPTTPTMAFPAGFQTQNLASSINPMVFAAPNAVPIQTLASVQPRTIKPTIDPSFVCACCKVNKICILFGCGHMACAGCSNILSACYGCGQAIQLRQILPN